jgi:hypothetical protein
MSSNAIDQTPASAPSRGPGWPNRMIAIATGTNSCAVTMHGTTVLAR